MNSYIAFDMLVKLLAIRLDRQKTTAKSLVIRLNGAVI
jgi:hypothetical protein